MGAQYPLQVPPQPSEAPHLVSVTVPQLRTQPDGQAVVQVPPQPSETPPHLPAQLGVQLLGAAALRAAATFSAVLQVW